MMADPIRVLLVEDEPGHAQLVQRYLASSVDPRFEVHWVDRLSAGLEALGANEPDVVLLDLSLPDSDPRTTADRMLAVARDVPVVVLTTSEDPEQALRAVKSGAQDHLPKPRVNADLLSRSLCYAIERKRSERQLKQFNETLERRVAERSAVAERRAFMLRRLAAELNQTERRERRRLAQFLHDDLQQMIAAARMRLDILSTQLSSERERQALTEAIELLKKSIAASRSLTLDLSPPVLNERGLGAALEWLARRSKEQYGLDVSVTISGDPQQLAEDTASLLLDAARELLFNIVKHARVDHADVMLDCTAPDVARMRIVDKGKGFDPAVLDNGDGDREQFGLFSIQERIEATGGSMHVETARGEGVTVTIEAPYGEREAQQVEEAAEEAAAAAASPVAAMPGAGGDQPIRVLVVDDHRIVREGLVAAIDAEPDMIVVDDAADGYAALTVLHQKAVDVVVMDVSMPNLSGVEATARIKARWPHVEVIALSMHEPADMAAAMKAAGARSYLTKSGPTEGLIAAIRTAADRPHPATSQS